MSTIYYRCSTKNKSGREVPGEVKSIPDVANADPYRRRFVQRFREDRDFRVNKVGFSDTGDIDEFLTKYEDFVKPGVKNVPADSADAETCVELYHKGLNLGPADKPKGASSTDSSGNDIQYFEIQQQDSQRTVLPGSSIRAWDAVHEQEFPDDVTRISAFNEASLLIAIRRRFENLHTYTYVGDIIISVNPYMPLPEAIRIQSPPQDYGLGENPNVYATAFFAYWAQLDPGSHGTPEVGTGPLRQSCIVSGESGAGKTYCCGRIMKFLNALSKQRVAQVGASTMTQSGAGDAGNSQRQSISDLVEDVSPFLEAFGNAKTKRNDNSSRFGKFMEILFDDGRIVGARIKHYLLEKSRTVSQGKGERSFHIFYQMLKGLSPAERKKYKLEATCDSYATIMQGGTHMVDSDDPTADERQFNNPYVPGDPDQSGVRACLANARCSPKQLDGIWRTLAALLKLGKVKFKNSEGVSNSGSGSHPASAADLAQLGDIASLLQLKGGSSRGEYLGDMLCINRLIIQGKELDSDVNASQAVQNRDALIKHIYARLFEFVIDCANQVLGADLAPQTFQDMQSSVSILDIFGFEVFNKNSLEQLFINFANEKLQNEFNKYIFEKELDLYSSEGLLQQSNFDFSYQNNTECCNLIEARRRRPLFIGILPLLEDQGQSLESTDEGFCRQLIKIFGRGSKAKKSKSQDDDDDENAEDGAKTPGDYFFARKGGGNDWFGIRHFAGEVQYHVEGFISKNQDKLPVQFVEVLEQETEDKSFIREHLCNSSSDNNVPNSPKRSGRRGGKSSKSISSKFVSNIADLAKRLRRTTPHYVRCVKPNDFKLRPIDGLVAFDAFKVYEQLLYAGVMEVVRVKKEGYPFRMEYGEFWQERVLRNGLTRLLKLDPTLSPREGASQVCTRILEDLERTGDGGPWKRKQWILGKTMLFGKHTLPAGIRKWTQTKVSNTICSFVRFSGIAVSSMRRFAEAVKIITSAWQRRYAVKKFQMMEPAVRAAQQLIRACIVKDFTIRAMAQQRSRRLGVRAIEQYVLVHEWRSIVRATLDKARGSSAMMIESLARSLIARRELQLRQQEHEEKIRAATQIASMIHCILANREWLQDVENFKRLQTLRRHMAGRVWHGRLLIRILKARKHHRQDKARIFIASSLLTLARRKYFVLLRKAAIRIQQYIRYRNVVRTMLRRGAARHKLQAFGRLTIVLAKFWGVSSATLRIQARWRAFTKRRQYVRLLHHIKTIQVKFLRPAFRQRLSKWLILAEAAIFAEDTSKLSQLVDCQYPGLSSLRECSNLINVRDRVRGTTCLHAAVQVGNLSIVQYLVRNGVDPAIQDAEGNTALHLACKHGDRAIDVVRYLVATSTVPLSCYKNRADNFAINVAAASSAVKVVQLLRFQMEGDISRGAEVGDFDAAAVSRQVLENSVLDKEPVNEQPINVREHLNGDDLVMAQLLVLGEPGCVDPETHSRWIQREKKASVVIQRYARKARALLQHRRAKVERARKVEEDSKINDIDPVLAARIDALRRRRRDRQRQLNRG